MKRFLQWVSVLLTLAVLSGCGSLSGTGSSSASSEESGVSNGTIAYVPLDDRPVNTDRVVYLAESLGFTVEMPEASLYHTCLDGQPLNADGTRYGDRAALYEWVAAQEAAGCSLYILSLDQLLSGGLVNSRSMTAQDVTLSDGTVWTESELLNQILTLLGSDPDNQVYFLDTVMRLAPTVGYDGFDLAGYEALRAYGMAERPALAGASLTVENIVANYSLGSDGNLVAAYSDTPLPKDMIRSYLASRERKLRLTDEVLRLSSGMDNLHFLIGVDDSAPDASIQTSEIDYLRQALGGRGALLSGADEDGMLAVCRLYEDTVFTGTLPTVSVRYFGGSEHTASSDYDHQPLTEIVNAHLQYLGLTQSDSDADLQVLVLTAPAEGVQADTVCSDLIDALRENEKSGIPTILMDAAKNAYGTSFQELLTEKTDLARLLGYGGYYDLANVTGVSLSNGVARWLCLAQQGTCTSAQNKAFLRTLSDSLLKDLCYKNQAKPDLAAYIRDELDGNPDNFVDSATDSAAVLSRLETDMTADTAPVLKNFARGNLISSLTPFQTVGCGGLTLSGYSFPWQRIFEIRMKIDVNDLTKSHKSSLFSIFS